MVHGEDKPHNKISKYHFIHFMLTQADLRVHRNLQIEQMLHT